jgi:hypothetical protein
MLTRADPTYFWCIHWSFSIFLSTVPTDLDQLPARTHPLMGLSAECLYTDEHLLTLQMEATSNTQSTVHMHTMYVPCFNSVDR